MKRLGVLTLAFVMCLSLFGCGGEVTAENMSSDTIYNTELGYAVSLGMTKKEVDTMLGEPVKNYSYDYGDGLSIDYEDGKVKRLWLSRTFGPWVVQHGIYPGKTVEDVIDAFGENDIFDVSTGNDLGIEGYLIQYYLDKEGQQCDVTGRYASISFHLSDDQQKVGAISVSK